MIDWKGMIAHLTGKPGWIDAEGPDHGVGECLWFGAADDEDEYVRVDIDQGHATLTHGEDEDATQIWAGEIESIANDETLAAFVTTPAPSR